MKMTARVNSLLSGVQVSIIHQFLRILETALKKRAPQICRESTHA